jgi:hypothetical protein
MQDFSGAAKRQRGAAGPGPGVAALFVVLALLSVAVPSAGQSINESSNGTGPSSPSAAVGEGRVVSCQQVRENPTADSSAAYRIVRGSCSLSIADGEVLSRVWFKADGGEISIDASGSGWTIRNVAITNHSNAEDSPLTLQVGAREGVGIVANIWASGIASNVLFVHPDHRGAIRFRGVTFVDVQEDGAYASRPGNPPSITEGDPKILGQEGTVGFRQAFLRDIGNGPKAGYGIRLGSDGSYLINSTLINTDGPAFANTFASGQNPKRHSEIFVGVVVRNVDIIQPEGAGPGVRLNNHQGSIKPQREWTAITTFENVDIEASEPIERNLAGGEEPVVRGSYDTSGADPTPPPLAPRSPVRAASGVGGGTGSIGGPVGGPGSVLGLNRIARLVSLLVVGVVVAIGVLAVVVIAWIERDGDGGGL